MGKTGIWQDSKGVEVKITLTKCNNCERDVRLSYVRELTPKEREELQKRMLCSNCLNKKLEAKK